jgi:hypothetical protein
MPRCSRCTEAFQARATSPLLRAKTEEQWRRAIDDHNLMVILLRRRDLARWL